MIERSRGDEAQNAGTGWCLGVPSHEVEDGRVICGICGTLVAYAQLGAYQARQFLGRGRSGDAYLAVHQRLKHPVVLKLFPPDRTAMFLWESARQECLFVAQIRHSAILPVLSCGMQQLEEHSSSSTSIRTVTRHQELFLVTICQYVRYPLLAFLSRVGREDAQGTRVVNLIQQMSLALSTAHVRNIVHGALTPGNILVDEQEHLWIADFGLARLHPPTAPYLAPELYDASRISIQKHDMTHFWQSVTPASDQYTFALLCQQLLFHMLHQKDFERVLPALQRGSHQQPDMRFSTIDMFTTELFTLLSQRRRTQLLLENGRAHLSENEQRSFQGLQDNKDIRSDNEGAQKTSPGSALRAWNSGKTPALPETNSVLALEKRADKLFTLRNYAEAIQVYQQALALDSSRASIWLALGDAFLASTQYSEALTTYQRTIALNPNDSLAWFNSGVALDALGRHREASVCYERASQLNS